MQNEVFKQKVNNFRSEVLKTFMLLFIPHLGVLMIVLNVTNNPSNTLLWQSIWFGIYFISSVTSYIFAPRLVKWNEKE